MVKDYVKSAKDTNFPTYFETPVDNDKMNQMILEFLQHRDMLYTGGIVLKDFVDLKRYADATNEYRAFYLNGKLISLNKNSNQPDNSNDVPGNLTEQFTNLPSNFYTVDFAELANGNWIVIEVGDGQVSGLSPNQYIIKFYESIKRILYNK